MKKYGLIGLKGEMVFPFTEYDSLKSISSGLMACRKNKNDKMGYINVKQQFVIPPMFHQAFPFDPITGLALIYDKRDGLDFYGMIDRSGKFILKPEYAGLRKASDGFIHFRSYAHHGYYGYMDLRGNIVLPPIYKYACPFSCGLARVMYPDSLDRSYFIDPSGKRVLGPYETIPAVGSDFNKDGFVWAGPPGKVNECALINTAGQVLLRYNPKRIFNHFEDGLARAYDVESKKFGFVDISGEWVIPPKFDNADYCFRGGFAEAAIGGKPRADLVTDEWVGSKWGLIDSTGREFFPFTYKEYGWIKGVHCGRIMFHETGSTERKGKWGYLSSATGKVVIPPRFKYAIDFSEGFALVWED